MAAAFSAVLRLMSGGKSPCLDAGDGSLAASLLNTGTKCPDRMKLLTTCCRGAEISDALFYENTKNKKHLTLVNESKSNSRCINIMTSVTCRVKLQSSYLKPLLSSENSE